MDDIGKRVLGLAEALGWPEGVGIPDLEDETVTVTIPGGEAGWGGWLSPNEESGDEEGGVLHALEWAHRVRGTGFDPGPPQDWFAKAELSLEAEIGMADEGEDDEPPAH